MGFFLFLRKRTKSCFFLKKNKKQVFLNGGSNPLKMGKSSSFNKKILKFCV